MAKSIRVQQLIRYMYQRGPFLHQHLVPAKAVACLQMQTSGRCSTFF